ALRFAAALIEEGHQLYRVFFYHDGVYNGNALIVPPEDTIDISAEWAALAKENDVDLVVCIAASLKRGILDAGESKRYDKSSADLREGFGISGLGQLLDAAMVSDRFVTFGA
ncbi:MAG: sulfurtransferase complex subunit TusD, partial [Gammaproteobacteria bacterium]